MTARISSSSQFEAWSQIIPGQWRVRPSGVTPLRIARPILTSDHLPMPISGSGVMFRVYSDPNGFQLIFAPPAQFGRVTERT